MEEPVFPLLGVAGARCFTCAGACRQAKPSSRAIWKHRILIHHYNIITGDLGCCSLCRWARRPCKTSSLPWPVADMLLHYSVAIISDPIPALEVQVEGLSQANARLVNVCVRWFDQPDLIYLGPCRKQHPKSCTAEYCRASSVSWHTLCAVLTCQPVLHLPPSAASAVEISSAFHLGDSLL